MFVPIYYYNNIVFDVRNIIMLCTAVVARKRIYHKYAYVGVQYIFGLQDTCLRARARVCVYSKHVSKYP